MTTSLAIAAAAASGLFLALSQPSADVSSLAWLGLVPLLMAMRGRSGRAAFGVGWVTGFTFSVPVLYWIAPTVTNYTRIATPVAIALLVLLCVAFAAFFGVFALVVEWLAAAGLSRVLSAPLIWVVIEWSRTFFPIAFPWALLGYSQHDVLAVIQIADVTGIYGVSALLVFVATASAEVARDGVGRHKPLLATTIAVVVAVVSYGAVRISQVTAWPERARVTVGVVQANVAQDEKWDQAFQEEILSRYLEISSRAAAAGAELIVWPEAAVPFLVPLDRRTARLSEFASESGTYLLVGAPGLEYDAERRRRHYNRAWVFDPGGGTQGPYDKIQLVPFGEYIPFGWALGWVETVVEAVGDFAGGTRHVVFDGPQVQSSDGPHTVRFASLICYEGIFPALTRHFVASGAEILVNISNDAWYGRTSAPYQHLAMAAVRAVENRVAVVRGTNTGISAVIDRVGRVRNRTPLFEEAMFVDDVILTDHASFYLLVGDLFVYLCIAGVALLIALRLRLGTC